MQGVYPYSYGPYVPDYFISPLQLSPVIPTKRIDSNLGGIHTDNPEEEEEEDDTDESDADTIRAPSLDLPRPAETRDVIIPIDDDIPTLAERERTLRPASRLAFCDDDDGDDERSPPLFKGHPPATSAFGDTAGLVRAWARGVGHQR
jgi:hypothetical protein